MNYKYLNVNNQSDGIFQNNVVSVANALLSCNISLKIYENCSFLMEEGKEILKKIFAACMENKDYHGVMSPNKPAMKNQVEI